MLHTPIQGGIIGYVYSGVMYVDILLKLKVKMFNNREYKDRYLIVKAELDAERTKSFVTLANLRIEYKLKLKEKQFELDHFKDNEIKSLSKAITSKDLSIAVLTAEKEQLNKLVDLNADLLDIKNLVNKLIDKLPTINLTKLSLTNKE